MTRNVHGSGTLVPEDIRWLTATTSGRVESIVLRPGANVKPDSVILVTDGLPTQGKDGPGRSKTIDSDGRLKLFSQAIKGYPNSVPMNVILVSGFRSRISWAMACMRWVFPKPTPP